jgi:hypothetical protein
VNPVIIEATGTISKPFRTYPAQPTGKAQNKETANSSHIGLCTSTSGSTVVKLCNIFHVQYNITCATNCRYRTAVTLYSLCMNVQLHVTIYNFILETQKLYMFQAFLAHPQE